MSWDASLYDDRGHCEGDWNYTHNTNKLINAALADIGQPQKDTWWRTLNGMDGPEGAEFLHQIIMALRANPDKFVPMNPPNGWGDYDSLIKVLEDMKASVPEWPTQWIVHG